MRGQPAVESLTARRPGGGDDAYEQFFAANPLPMWVYDADSHKMVYNGSVRDGDRVRVNTETNQILVGGRTVSERPLAGDHRYEIYFRRPR